MSNIMDNIIEDQENLREFLDEADLQQYYELFRDILKVNKLSQLKFVAIEDLSQIGLSKPEQRRYKKLYSRYFPNSYMTKLKRLFNGNKKNEMGQVLKDFQTVRNDMNIYVPKTHIISIEDIIINKKLGMGHFGVVQQGKWLTGNEWVEVAIKCLGNDRMTSNSSEFLKEAAVMHRMAHPNIVRLYGVVLHLDSLMLVTELAPFRSLLECFHEDTLRCNFSVSILCEFAEQICNGMTYLTNERLIHRDLAARNILVFSKNKVKISDFGLSRALGAGKDYYQSKYNKNLKLPVAWCAPECILYLKFTTASDVWAFGVCLWEMFTYGAQPWEAFNGQQILDAINTPNFQRLERPQCCTEAYYSLMMECWSHEPGARPTFEDLMPRLRALRPEQVQTTVSFKRPGDGRRNNCLEFKSGQIITVLGKENYTKSAMWYGALPGGACGMFDPKQTKPCIKHERGSYASSLSPHQTRNSSRSIRSSLLRSDVKRHTYTGKRTIHRSMISSPQGDVKHTGHVGLDGAYFGDLSFLDSAGCPPRQIVTPYKPSEDLEQVPLINPNSPSHLTTNTSSYPLLNSSKPSERDEVDLSYADKSKSVKKAHKSILEPTTSLLNKVKSATLGRSHKNEEPTKHDEVHEYHEISDTDTESIAAEMQGDYPPDSPVMKGCGDFSQSLLAEMESIFKGFDEKRNDEVRNMETEVAMALRTLALSKMDKKKTSQTGTMKPMSAHDEKTLNTAVAMANEITSRSMTDLDGEQKPPNLPSEKSKFHFKFPLVSSLHATHHDTEKDLNNKVERRNFSEEAKSVPDIHATITEESKQAYVSLIEEPTPSSSLVPHMSQTAATLPKPSTVPKPAPRANNIKEFLSLPKKKLAQSSEDIPPKVSSAQQDPDEKSNVIPLLPRGAKPKLVDKPRHIRKYPLKIPSSYDFHETPAVQAQAKPQTIIYQNTLDFALPRYKVEDTHPKDILNVGVDVFDGPDTKKADTNPFTAMQNEMVKPGSSSVNPFKYYLTETSDDSSVNCEGAVGGVSDPDEVSLNKDHVSVEDLLEFADQKPSARQRGVESDEVRIMNKVLKQQVKAEDCLEALEFSGWNVHIAIKLLHVKIAVGKDIEVSFEECQRELDNAEGDIAKAAAIIILYNKDKQKYLIVLFIA